MLGLTVLFMFMVGRLNGQGVPDGHEESNLNFCVDAALVSQTNACGGQSNGSVTFVADTVFNAATCCTDITTLQCSLRIVSDVIAQITIDIADISIPITFSDLAPATYNIRIKGFNGAVECANNTKNNFVTISGSGGITLSNASNIIDETCVGSKNGSFQISVSGGDAPYSFEISNSSQNFSNVGEGQPVNFTMLGAATYTVTATDDSGCSGTKTVAIALENPEGISVQQNITQVSCFNGNNGIATLTANGAGATSFTYNWSNGANGQTASNLIAGTYQVTITANTGCSKVESVMINQPPELKLTLAKTDISCNGLSDGSITATTSGGTGTRTLKWNNNSTDNTLSNLPAGIYSATVTDANNCTATASATIAEPGALDFIVDPSQNPVQSGQLLQILLSGADDIDYFAWNITELINVTPTTLAGNVSNNSNIIKTFTLDKNRSLGAATFQIIPFFNTTCTGDTQFVSITVLPVLGTDDAPFIPEIYTPNGDGQNDVWQVAMPDGVEKGDYTIFNRLGGKVFEGDTLNPWDGSACPDGPYFYVLRYTQDGAEKVVKGAVTILRTTDYTGLIRVDKFDKVYQRINFYQFSKPS